MKEVHGLWRRGRFGLQTAQQVGLRIIGRRIKPDSGGDLLSQELSKLPQFGKAIYRTFSLVCA